jgi:hypothetical protein
MLNEKLHDLYCSQNIFSDKHIKKDKMGMVCGMHGEEGKCIPSFIEIAQTGKLLASQGLYSIELV